MTGLGICGYGWRVAILADSPTVLQVLDRYVAPWLARIPADTGRADSVFEIHSDAAGFSLMHRGSPIAYGASIEDLVHPLESWIDDALVRRLTGLVAVHAAAASYGDIGVLLPSPTHGGKSTLVHELLLRGWTYFSDEYALIDGEGRLHPYPRALMLRNGGEQARPVLAAELNAATGSGPARVGLILSVEYHRASEWHVRQVSQAEMVIILLKHTPQFLSREAMASLTAACGSAECYTGVRGEVAAAALQIARMLGMP
jgi:hypothetical protein